MVDGILMAIGVTLYYGFLGLCLWGVVVLFRSLLRSTIYFLRAVRLQMKLEATRREVDDVFRKAKSDMDWFS